MREELDKAPRLVFILILYLSNSTKQQILGRQCYLSLSTAQLNGKIKLNRFSTNIDGMAMIRSDEVLNMFPHKSHHGMVKTKTQSVSNKLRRNGDDH